MVGTAGIVTDVDGVVLYRRELLALFADNLRDLLEEDVEIADALFDVSNLVLALADEGILEVHLVLGGQMDLFLLLLLQLELLPLVAGLAGGSVIKSDLGGGDGGPLFLEGGALKGLELGEGGFELAR